MSRRKYTFTITHLPVLWTRNCGPKRAFDNTVTLDLGCLLDSKTCGFLYFCLDIDECENGENACDVNALCSNNPGSYMCQCIRGFEGDGRTCEGNFTRFPSYRIAFSYLHITCQESILLECVENLCMYM